MLIVDASIGMDVKNYKKMAAQRPTFQQAQDFLQDLIAIVNTPDKFYSLKMAIDPLENDSIIRYTLIMESKTRKAIEIR